MKLKIEKQAFNGVNEPIKDNILVYCYEIYNFSIVEAQQYNEDTNLWVNYYYNQSIKSKPYQGVLL